SPRELYEFPTSRFVAGFIGKMNFFAGPRTAQGVAFGGGILAGAAAEAASTNGAAVAAVRPERLRLTAARPQGTGNAVAGRIVDIAYHGQDLNVHLAVEGAGEEGNERVLVRLPAGEAEGGDWRPGLDVWCCWDAAHTRILAV
ncbi:MAG: TOBE domain-containing protein, partial [Kiloniellaceae bacterium]